LDVGTKTVGIAVCDAERRLASPVRTLARRGVRDDADRLVAIARDLEAAEAVVGLPFELDGTEGRSARLARQIGAALVERGLVVRYVDERYTSVEANRQLIDAGLSRERRKAVIDQAAAVLILQSWLDHPELEENG
jgi:putative Holliday junction resolvase